MNNLDEQDTCSFCNQVFKDKPIPYEIVDANLEVHFCSEQCRIKYIEKWNRIGELLKTTYKKEI